MNMKQNHFGSNIKYLRRKRLLTQNELACEVCISQNTISDWEQNEKYPNIVLVAMLADYFGVTIDDLFFKDLREI